MTMGWAMRRPQLILNETRLHWVMAGMKALREDGNGVLNLSSLFFWKIEAQMHILSSIMSLPYYIYDVHLLSP